VGKRSLSQADLTALEADATAHVDPTLVRDKLDELIMRRVFGPERQKSTRPFFCTSTGQIDRSNIHVLNPFSQSCPIIPSSVSFDNKKSNNIHSFPLPCTKPQNLRHMRLVRATASTPETRLANTNEEKFVDVFFITLSFFSLGRSYVAPPSVFRP